MDAITSDLGYTDLRSVCASIVGKLGWGRSDLKKWLVGSRCHVDIIRDVFLLYD